ncbi:MAG: hypothetical protein ACK5QW_04735 [Cyanobacteriota bacterium]|jgi:hypothetical protein
MVNSLLQPVVQQLNPLIQQALQNAVPWISQYISNHKGLLLSVAHTNLQRIRSNMTQEQRDQLDACILWAFKQYAFHAVSTTVGIPSPLLSVVYNKVEELFKGDPGLIVTGKEYAKEELERLALKEKLKKQVASYQFVLPTSAGPTSAMPTLKTCNGKKKPPILVGPMLAPPAAAALRPKLRQPQS